MIRSIGYKTVEVDSDVPYDPATGTIPNIAGRVVDRELVCLGKRKGVRESKYNIIPTNTLHFLQDSRYCPTTHQKTQIPIFLTTYWWLYLTHTFGIIIDRAMEIFPMDISAERLQCAGKLIFPL